MGVDGILDIWDIKFSPSSSKSWIFYDKSQKKEIFGIQKVLNYVVEDFSNILNNFLPV